MSLHAGSRLAAYEITGSLGAGGMGEVFRARDTRLNRDVAIKVLPELFTRDPDPSTSSGSPRATSRGDRLARFTREAQTLAALNHPNIAQIYGVVDLPDAHARTTSARAPVVNLFDLEERDSTLRQYDTADGERFVVVRTIRPSRNGVAIVQNWAKEFAR